MVDYLYDGAFEGFLTCVHAHYYQEKANGIFPSGRYQSNLLSTHCQIETDPEKAMKVYQAIGGKISPKDLARVYRVFLSCAPDKEMKLLRYIEKGFKTGPKLSMFHGDPVVFEVQQIERKVAFEVERLSGLLRFSVLKGGVLYASIEPDHDICELLADHFCDRFRHDPFVIHDKKRAKALIANEGDWYIAEFTPLSLPELSGSENEYRKLWKEYFDAIAIKERENPRCQKNLMPVRYWKNLTEMQGHVTLK